MYTGKHHTSISMKKMNTERLHRLYQAVGFEMMFNPYEEQARGFMIALISVRLERIFGNPAEGETSIHEISTAKQGRESRAIVENGKLTYEPIYSRLETWWFENGNQLAAEPTRGRIPEFSYDSVKDMYRMSANFPKWDVFEGFTVNASYKEIAKVFQTTYMNVYQIVNGISYQWAMAGV